MCPMPDGDKSWTVRDAVHVECTTEEYHARDEWSNSQLVMLPDDPISFNGLHVAKTMVKPVTAAMKLGTDLHRVLLDGTPIVTIPPEVLSKSASKAGGAWKDWSAEHADAVQVKADDPLLSMLASVRAEPKAMERLEADGPVEHSIIAQDLATGIGQRARPDKIAIYRDDAVVVELKSTVDPLPAVEDGPLHFAKKIYDFAYHRQAAWYWDLVERLPGVPLVLGWVFVAVQNTPPYECVVHELAGRAVELGRQKNRAALDDLARRLASGNWHSKRHDKTHFTDLPEWAYPKPKE